MSRLNLQGDSQPQRAFCHSRLLPYYYYIVEGEFDWVASTRMTWLQQAPSHQRGLEATASPQCNDRLWHTRWNTGHGASNNVVACILKHGLVYFLIATAVPTTSSMSRRQLRQQPGRGTPAAPSPSFRRGEAFLSLLCFSPG